MLGFQASDGPHLGRDFIFQSISQNRVDAVQRLEDLTSLHWGHAVFCAGAATEIQQILGGGAGGDPQLDFKDQEWAHCSFKGFWEVTRVGTRLLTANCPVHPQTCCVLQNSQNIGPSATWCQGSNVQWGRYDGQMKGYTPLWRWQGHRLFTGFQGSPLLLPLTPYLQ